MFYKIVKNQYIGKSKLTFTRKGEVLRPETLIGELAKDFTDWQGIPMGSHIYKAPDYFIEGHFFPDTNSWELEPEESLDIQRLYITGIHKDFPNLDEFKIGDAFWSSYYEDNYRGYLFQITPLAIRMTFKDSRGNDYAIITH